MTPDKAIDLLHGTTPGPWGVEYDHDWAIGISAPEGIVFGPYYDQEEMEQWETGSDADLRLAAAAPVLAAMIPGMREEWRAEFQAADDKKWYPLTEWAEGEPDRRPWNVAPTRIVRRYVTEPEEA